MVITKSELLADALVELEKRIRQNQLRDVEDLKSDFPSIWNDSEARLELIYSEYVLRAGNGDKPNRKDWFSRYPDLRERLERLFGLYDLLNDGDTLRPQYTVEREVPTAEAAAADHPDGYEVLGELGRGGMAVVYRARHRQLNRVVALKVLRWAGWNPAVDAQRVRREAKLIARIQHPHIVQVFEVGEWNGDPFLAMEYVAGSTLADALARLHKQGQTGVNTGEAVALVGLLAKAVQAAHENGIIHRDLKPANVLLAADPASPLASPRIADFGLAITTDVSNTISQTLALAGTPCYMAPEQAAGDRPAIGPRTDVYALGGILYELLTGRPPFQGATVLETLDLVRNTEPVSPRWLRPNLPRDLDTICLKCLSKDPARRYESAAALADDLARFHDGKPILARPVGAFEKGWKWCRRKPLLAGLAAALALAVGLGVGGVRREYQRAEAERRLADERRVQAEDNMARSNRMLGHSRQSLTELMELGREMTCHRHSVEAGRQVLEVAREHFQRMLAVDDDSDLRRQAVQVCLRLTDVYHQLGRPTDASHRLVEAIAHADHLVEQLDVQTRSELLQVAIYGHTYTILSGGPRERWPWILDRAEVHLRYLRADAPAHDKATAWHHGLLNQRAILAAAQDDWPAERQATEGVLALVATQPEATETSLNRYTRLSALCRVSRVRRIDGRLDEAFELAARAVREAEAMPAFDLNAPPRELALCEAHAASLDVEVARGDRDAVARRLAGCAELVEPFHQLVLKMELPLAASFASVAHRFAASRAAALDLLDCPAEGTEVLSEVVAVRPAGTWKVLPFRPILANHAQLIDRLLAAGRTADARRIADIARPWIEQFPPDGPADRAAIQRLKKAIDALPPK